VSGGLRLRASGIGGAVAPRARRPLASTTTPPTTTSERRMRAPQWTSDSTTWPPPTVRRPTPTTMGCPIIPRTATATPLTDTGETDYASPVSDSAGGLLDGVRQAAPPEVVRSHLKVGVPNWPKRTRSAVLWCYARDKSDGATLDPTADEPISLTWSKHPGINDYESSVFTSFQPTLWNSQRE